MNQILVCIAHFCVVYNIVFVTYYFYKELFGRQPVSFLEMWLYIESKFELLQKAMNEEQKELIKKIGYSFFNSEERSFENFKSELKKWKNENKDKTYQNQYSPYFEYILHGGCLGSVWATLER